jgi:hypothetical protein
MNPAPSSAPTGAARLPPIDTATLNRLGPWPAGATAFRRTPVLPCVFLFRHAVELAIKQLIADMFVVAGKAVPEKVLSREHGLAVLWGLLKSDLDAWLDTRRYDAEPMPDSGEVDEIVADLDPIDLKGVAFRYATTTGGKDCHRPACFARRPPSVSGLTTVHAPRCCDPTRSRTTRCRRPCAERLCPSRPLHRATGSASLLALVSSSEL